MASGGIGKLRSILWQDANAFRFEWKGSNGDEVYCCFCYHVKDPRYEGTLEEVIQAARDAGVQILCANGTHEADWDEVASLAHAYPETVIPNFGLHPWWVQDRSESWLDHLRTKLEEYPSAGLGECGLDGLRVEHVDMAVQEAVFASQLHLAKELHRPVSVHCVKAFEQMLALVKEIGPFPAGFMLHSWTGGPEMVRAFSKIEGVHFSLSGFTTRMSIAKRSALIKEIPLERLILETDSPDGLPKECKKKGDTTQKNYPSNLGIVLKNVATILDLPEARLAGITFKNAAALFRI